MHSQNRLRKQEAGHVEQIAKLEADAEKQRAMLQSVREQLEALVADPSVPTGPAPEHRRSLRRALLLRLHKICWMLLRLLMKTWMIVKMRMIWNGHQFVDFLAWSGVTRLG